MRFITWKFLHNYRNFQRDARSRIILSCIPYKIIDKQNDNCYSLIDILEQQPISHLIFLVWLIELIFEMRFPILQYVIISNYRMRSLAPIEIFHQVDQKLAWLHNRIEFDWADKLYWIKFIRKDKDDSILSDYLSIITIYQPTIKINLHKLQKI